MSNPFSLPKEWMKTAAVRAIKEGGTALIEEVASELSTDQLKNLITVLSKVRDSRKKHVTIDVKVG